MYKVQNESVAKHPPRLPRLCRGASGSRGASIHRAPEGPGGRRPHQSSGSLASGLLVWAPGLIRPPS